MVAVKPTSLRVRMYNVGFGDCFLVSFFYATAVADAAAPDEERDARHILFDCGSTSKARSRQSLLSIARSIDKDCEHHLDALVITHRHRDHLSAFGSTEAAEVLAALKPRLLVRSWTEHPDLDKDAKSPVGGQPIVGLAAAGVEPAALTGAFVASMRRAQRLTERVVERSDELGVGQQSDLVSVADDQMPNQDAVDLLRDLAAGGKGEYLSAEHRQTRLNDMVPGVTFKVLGPPTPAQQPSVTKQAEVSDEFWLGVEAQTERLFAQPVVDATLAPLGTARWIIERIQSSEYEQVAGLVRWLDDALNNTSVILLIETGDHHLLFGGDAQVENWGWVLNQKEDPSLIDALRKVDFYKVGHHGSRNASPRSLVRLWQERPTAPFISMMSTKHGVHGSGEHVVPRPTLITALEALGPVVSTDDSDADWHEVTATLPSGAYVRASAP